MFVTLSSEHDPITLPEGSDTVAAGLDPQRMTDRKFAGCGHGLIGTKPQQALAAL